MIDIGLVIQNINIQQSFPVFFFKEEEVIYKHNIDLGKEIIILSTLKDYEENFEELEISVSDLEDSIEDSVKDNMIKIFK
jgi:hypothetical protein